MFLSLWRRLRNANPGPSREKCRRGGRRPSYRPRLEPLEDRLLPALSAGGVPNFAAEALSRRASSPLPLQEVRTAAPGAVVGLQQMASTPPAATNPIQVTVAQNSPETVINVGAVFAAQSGLQQGDGLQLSTLGNTNSGLVTPDLSEAMLTLTYTGGKSGTATITVCATDADGVSAQQTFVVTVTPLTSVVTGAVSPIAPAGTGR